MAQYSSDEKRRDPRLVKSVPVKISREDGELITETVNLSRSGAYCRVSHSIEPMTKLKVHLLLPSPSNDTKATKKISCTGVVVRVEPILESTDQNIAVFFNDISPKDAEIISDYIISHLEE